MERAIDTIELLSRIDEANVRATAPNRKVVKTGPFWILISPSTPMRWLNNAALVDRTAPAGSAEVRALVAAFEQEERLPRLELFTGLHDDLIAVLQAEGFEIESEMPVMVCTPETFRPQRSPEFTLERVLSGGDVEAVMRIVDTAFEHDEPLTPERIEAHRRSLEKGTIRTALAYLDGQPAAVASMVCAESVGELAGVGTLPEFRRRGAASAVSTFLLEEFFGGADLAWLSAGDETARIVYERLGFELIGSQINISLPSPSQA